MFDAAIDNIEPDRITRHRVSHNGSPVTFATVLELWQTDSEFRGFFTNLLADSPFSAYRWETPAISKSTASQPFEFVLINSPGFCTRETDVNTYTQYFTNDDTDFGVIAFANLRGDATLVVPSPRAPHTAYGHLAAFLRNAPQQQVDSIWRVIGTQVQSRLDSRPIWVSTAGGGVALTCPQ